MTNDSQFIYERDDAGPAVGGASWLPLMVHVSGPGANESLELYTHGPDLSGTLGGAGGIGGILSCNSGSVSRFFHCDGNGNVIALTDTNGTLISRLDYAPFGALLTSSGPTPRFQWSSKEWDGVVGLIYYGYRYYSSVLGRWLSRDPVEERSDLRLFRFAHNDPVNEVDLFGLWHYYGNWCGPNWSGGQEVPADRLSPHVPVLPPIDSLDECCRDHDYCYADCRARFPCNRQRQGQCLRPCDHRLRQCVLNLDPNPLRWPRPAPDLGRARWARRGIIIWF